MEKTTEGTVLSVKKQWWLKVNTKAVRMHALDGATFPHIVKVRFIVDDKDYIKRVWFGAGLPVPAEGAQVRVAYEENKPSKCRLL